MTPEEKAKRVWLDGQLTEQEMLERYEKLIGIDIGGEYRPSPPRGRGYLRVIIGSDSIDNTFQQQS